MNVSANKSCLIISDGPVPSPEHTKVEGGGLRCWGLAKGMLANDAALDVTVAYNHSYKKDAFTDSYEGVKITTWDDTSIDTLIAGFDSVVVSYCMGNLSMAVVEALGIKQQLILDCYVPIYVEMSARKSKNITAEYEAFNFELNRWAHVLRRGDVFLCANEAQKEFYEGVLAAVGRINPVTYGEDLIEVVPYGIYREKAKATEKPISRILHDKDSLKLLWFGGIYPWFDLNQLIEAVGEVNKSKKCELIIVGAKNPFNSHPDFLAKYDELVSFIEDNGHSDTVHIIDWIEFNQRANWYLDSDVVIVVNEEGPENELAWRTRLVDFVWADLPILTNGGDPLGEMLIANNAAARLKGLTPGAIADSIADLISNKERIETYKKNVKAVRKDLYWDVVTASLVEKIKSQYKPSDLIFRSDMEVINNAGASKLARAKTKLRKIPRYYKTHGLRATLSIVDTKVSEKLKHTIGQDQKRQPKTIVISHQLDLSGAPYVLIDIVKAMQSDERFDGKIDFRTFTPISKQNIAALNQINIKPKVYLDKNVGFTFVKGDTVLLNSFAQSSVLIDSILGAVEDGRIEKLAWYGHEATPKGFLNPYEGRRVARLLEKNRITIYATAKKCMEEYIEFFGTSKNVRHMPYRFDVAKGDFRTLPSTSFDDMSFILPGTVGDGRKGQLPVLYAFIDFYNNYYKSAPERYRNFKLKFVGVEDDFLSQQIKLSAKSGLGEHFECLPKVSREENLAVARSCNATICYSLQEALPLFVYEGMAFGHVLIRNESSGQEEQLDDGKNGFAVDSSDFGGLVEVIEKVLNKEKVSNEQLSKMSARSTKKAMAATKNTYTIVDDLAE